MKRIPSKLEMAVNLATAIALIIVLIVMAGGCNGGKIESAVLTGQRADLKVLGGYNVNGISFGGVATWDQSSIIDSVERTSAVGFYIGAETTWQISAIDTPERAPVPFQWFDGLTMVPYGRVEFLDDISNDNFGNLENVWIAGSRFLLDESGKVSIAAEYSTGGPNGDDVFLGPLFLF
jgi:hypothetical protein